MNYRPTKLPVREDRGLNYSNGYQAQVNTCVECGALVMDFTTHDRWHMAAFLDAEAADTSSDDEADCFALLEWNGTNTCVRKGEHDMHDNGSGLRWGDAHRARGGQETGQ